MADALGPIAAAYGILMAISPVLQIRRMLQTHSSADLSVGYLVVLEIGFLLWAGYAVLLPNPFLAVPNVAASLVGAVTIGIALWLRRRPD